MSRSPIDCFPYAGCTPGLTGPLDHVADQMEAVDVVHHAHVE
jgi:hypothetical protein